MVMSHQCLLIIRPCHTLITKVTCTVTDLLHPTDMASNAKALLASEEMLGDPLQCLEGPEKGQQAPTFLSTIFRSTSQMLISRRHLTLSEMLLAPKFTSIDTLENPKVLDSFHMIQL